MIHANNSVLMLHHSMEKYDKTRPCKKEIREINSSNFLVKVLISRKKCGFFRKNRDRVLKHFSTLCAR